MDRLKSSSAVNAGHQYKGQQDSGNMYHSENVYYVKSDIENLKGKLEKGVILQARIILDIGDKKYLLRFQGGNYIMESDLRFERFDEVLVSVEATEPKLKLKILPPPRKKNNNSGQMDILV